MNSSRVAEPVAASVLESICRALRSARRVGLVGHVTPDADCVAAISALWLALPELAVTPVVVLPARSLSRRLRFLVCSAGLSHQTDGDLSACDLVVVLDTAKERRVNLPAGQMLPTGVPVINIDHHASNPGFGQLSWIAPAASSTCELVYQLLCALGCQITPTIATLLYAGLHSDTRGFSLPNTTPQSLRIAHELATCGARIAEVCEKLQRSQSREEFELLKLIYANTRLSDDGRLAWSTASYDEIRRVGCDAATIDDQVEIPRCIEGILVAILFSEGEPGIVRLNFRGERGVSVLELAQQFGGGGHHSSAGARIKATLEEAVARVLPVAQEYVARLKPTENSESTV
jgi:phosphoesterase RecJ-like protein